MSAHELASRPVVGREGGSGTRLTLERALTAVAGIESVVEPAAQLSTTAAIMATVIAGAGVGALSALAVRDDLAAGRLVRVPTEVDPMSRPLTAIWRANRHLGEGATRLLALASGNSHEILRSAGN